MTKIKDSRIMYFCERHFVKGRFYSAIENVSILSEKEYEYYEVINQSDNRPSFFFIKNDTKYNEPRAYYFYFINDTAGVEPVYSDSSLNNTIDNLFSNSLLHKKDPERIIQVLENRVLVSLPYIRSGEKFIL